MRHLPYLALPGLRLQAPDNPGVIWFAHWLVHWTGSDYGAPAYGYFEPYDLYSGLLGLGIVGLLLTHARKHNCHVARCWRLGRHPFTDEATGAVYSLCRRHHPGTLSRPPSKEVIDLIHARNSGSQA